MGELESNDVMLGMFSSGLVAQLRLLSSLLPTALNTIVGTESFNPDNLTALRAIVLQDTDLPRGLTFSESRSTSSMASASLGAPTGDPGNGEDEDAVSDSVVSMESETLLLRESPPSSPETSTDNTV